MANDLIPLLFGKSTGGAAIEIREPAAADQIGSQWLSMPSGYIDGLILEWVSGSSIRVTSGGCSLASGGTIAAASSITKAGINLGANTWGHVYAFLSGSSPDIEVSTTSPSAAYSGRARTKSGDTTRRYLGSVRTNPTGSIYRFDNRNGQFFYMEVVPASLAGGTNPTATAISLGNLIPETSMISVVAMTNTGTAAVRFRPTGAGFSSTNTDRMYGLTAGAYVTGFLPTNGTQQVDYQADSGGNANLSVLGYILER